MKTEFKGSSMLNPVPVVMVTCKDKNGKSNVITIAWVGTVCSKPPMVSISVRPERYSYDILKESMEFIINIPSSSQVKETDYCGVKSGRDVDKISEMKFTMRQGDEVNVDYIEECPINMECKVKQIISLGTHDMFIAEVLKTHINSDLIDDTKKICFDKANLISYCHGEYYPISKKPQGKFGYSVAKRLAVVKKNIKKYKK